MVDAVNKFPDDHVIAGINFIILLKTTIEKYLYTVYKSIVSDEAALLTASSLGAKWHGGLEQSLNTSVAVCSHTAVCPPLPPFLVKSLYSRP